MPPELQDFLLTAQASLIQLQHIVSQPEVAAPIAFVVVAGAVGYGIHRHFTARARVLPYIPSLSEAVDGELDETLRFLSAVHEMTMSITDAWNATRARKVGKASVEGVVRADALLPACRGVRDGVAAMRARFADFRVLADLAGKARGSLSDAWTYTNTHNYRTEVYTVTRTDSNGKTRTETRTRQVYENTDHYFTFNISAAQTAQGRIATLLAERARRDLPLPDIKRLRVRLDRVDPAQRMFLDRMVRDTILEDAEAEVTEAQVSQAANQWILGARVDEWLDQVIAGADIVEHSHADQMRSVLASRPSYHYLTTSRSHSGPPGYRAARSLGNSLSRLVEGWGSLQSMLRRCEEVAGDLASWAQDRAEEESDTDYVKAAASAYEAAFPESTLEIDQLPKHGWTIGLSLVAGAFAAAIAYFGMGGQI